MRVGHDIVRSTAVTLAMEQLKAAKDVQVFHEQAEWSWRHSLEVAAIAYVITRKSSRLNPDEALFAGLVHDIGRFYLLSRASAYPELVDHPEELDALIHEWHPSIGQAVLHEFELSEATLRAVSEHEHHPAVYPPRQLVDVITLANRVALQSNPPHYPAHVERDIVPIDNPGACAESDRIGRRDPHAAHGVARLKRPHATGSSSASAAVQRSVSSSASGAKSRQPWRATVTVPAWSSRVLVAGGRRGPVARAAAGTRCARRSGR